MTKLLKIRTFKGVTRRSKYVSMRLVAERIDHSTGLVIKIYKSISPNRNVGFRSKLVRKYEFVDEAGNRWIVKQKPAIDWQRVTVTPTWPDPPNPNRRNKREEREEGESPPRKPEK